jgi:hypothetical protein
MAFTGNENHTIPVEDAAAMNKRWRDANPDQPKGVYFSQSTLNDILAQSGCVGIRFFFALTDGGDTRLTFCGVDSSENDIIGIVGNTGILCPPTCGAADALNSDRK